MIGTRYTFVFSTPYGIPEIDGICCLSDAHARQMAAGLLDVVRILDGRRQVWPRPAPALIEPCLHDLMDDGA